MRVGCDVVALEEIENSLAQFGDRYLNRVFTAAELADCAGPKSLQRLAARFAAKEAVIKVFAEPAAAFPFFEIEVARSGATPVVKLTGTTARRAADQGWIETSLSLSHADCHAMAVVVVLCR
ncbi:MAG: holo-ACP synthase [Mycobacterium sp.]|nr:holo-ACP synthase [Mycobacterium sp.]